MIERQDRLIGAVGGLLIYESIFCLSTALSWLYSGKQVGPLNLPAYPFSIGLACFIGTVTYRFFRNPERHALWLGVAATLIAAFKVILFIVIGSSPKSPVPVWPLLGMSIQLILSPLIIGCGCLYLWRKNRNPQQTAAASPVLGR
jgi:hypothetical protein